MYMYVCMWEANNPEGDTQAPARRLSDIPSGRESGEGKGEEDERKKPMLQSAQETVASALGGSSRGELPTLFLSPFPWVDGAGG